MQELHGLFAKRLRQYHLYNIRQRVYLKGGHKKRVDIVQRMKDNIAKLESGIIREQFTIMDRSKRIKDLKLYIRNHVKPDIKRHLDAKPREIAFRQLIYEKNQYRKARRELFETMKVPDNPVEKYHKTFQKAQMLLDFLAPPQPKQDELEEIEGPPFDPFITPIYMKLEEAARDKESKEALLDEVLQRIMLKPINTLTFFADAAKAEKLYFEHGLNQIQQEKYAFKKPQIIGKIISDIHYPHGVLA